MTPWTDRSGKFSPLKAAVLLGLMFPGLWIALSWSLGQLGPRPVTEAIHETGTWAIRFLLVSLAVTPLRRIADWPKLIVVRRMIGLAALSYALAHLSLYIVDQNLDLQRVATEIARRVYLTIGFMALLGLCALGATSTDAAIRRLGHNWNRLHRVVYVIGVLAGLHFFMQTKADVFEATLTGGLFLLLMVYRILHWRRFSLSSPFVLLGAAIVAAVLTAAIEFAWYGLATGIPPLRVLAANLHFSYTVRPAWWVLLVGAVVALVPIVRPYVGTRRSLERVPRAARTPAE